MRLIIKYILNTIGNFFQRFSVPNIIKSLWYLSWFLFLLLYAVPFILTSLFIIYKHMLGLILYMNFIFYNYIVFDYIYNVDFSTFHIDLPKTFLDYIYFKASDNIHISVDLDPTGKKFGVGVQLHEPTGSRFISGAELRIEDPIKEKPLVDVLDVYGNKVDPELLNNYQTLLRETLKGHVMPSDFISETQKLVATCGSTQPAIEVIEPFLKEALTKHTFDELKRVFEPETEKKEPRPDLSRLKLAWLWMCWLMLYYWKPYGVTIFCTWGLGWISLWEASYQGNWDEKEAKKQKETEDFKRDNSHIFTDWWKK